MNNDEIVSDIISLIHSTTQSNYVICSRLSSKLFSYLSQIQLTDNSWKEFHQAIERFDQSIDHPDLQLFRQLIQTISICSNDYEERNYTLGRDQNTLMDSIKQLRDLLKSHVDLNCFLLVKLIEQQEIRLQLIDLMNLTGMNVGDYIHGLLFDIIHLICQIDPTFATSNVIDHPIVLNAIRIIENKSISTGIFALNLLTKLILINEPFPIQTNSQLINYGFLRSIFELIEGNSQNDEFISISIKFLLSLNLRFDYPNENPILLTLVDINERISSRALIERLIFLFNRNSFVDSISNNSIVKFFSDLFSEHGALFFSESNRCLIVEIISRELTDRSYSDEMTTAYLSLLELIFRNRLITSETCTRINELKICFQTYLDDENCSKENRFIINEIIRQLF